MSLKIYHSLSEIRTFRTSIDPKFKIGFVPTMGALHEGHLSLIREAKKKCELVICSIFVNPTQFDKAEDLEKYPRTLEEDIRLLSNAGTDVVFAPNAKDVYGENYYLRFDFGKLEKTMEGEFRNGHFNGVATIVSKLFHFIEPHFAFFGQKDLQQVAIIKDLCKALSFNTIVISCPIVRDINGLALSSRNVRLSIDEKKKALALSQTISHTYDIILKTQDIKTALKEGKIYFEELLGYKPEYLTIVNPENLENIENIKGTSEFAICIAATVGKVRLIDNEIFRLN